MGVHNADATFLDQAGETLTGNRPCDVAAREDDKVRSQSSRLLGEFSLVEKNEKRAYLPRGETLNHPQYMPFYSAKEFTVRTDCDTPFWFSRWHEPFSRN
jgi:hypothetical protein